MLFQKKHLTGDPKLSYPGPAPRQVVLPFRLEKSIPHSENQESKKLGLKKQNKKLVQKTRKKMELKIR
jgi:hypothetical protein